MFKKVFFIILFIIITFFFLRYFYNNNKLPATDAVNSSNTFSTTENIFLENNIISNNVASEKIDFSANNVLYEFTSADSFAAQGNPGIFKIFKINNIQMIFEYNHGWNFKESTIDRKISGVAHLNAENLYVFTEYVDEHKYSIIIDFSEEIVSLSEYVDDELFSRINLWS